ncbi:hypothetical protein PV325_002263 [Microctonus aethiopoides]|uniref:Deoxyribodipyrimidine photo-lyase n=1 Tax=Microctonus aethiopoides TaxID=144406 RepID=A0AA39FLG8_9HYME|nr:hypothetical protein PV325_002263 [Microctonus aethiopoides]KAK0092100.1 hypothetical protein PV326_002194 [Microctonus aethiopoides]KAK0171782.1 hypothetical protein PV328_005186 [Microctonus aethiopoides]
MSGESPAKKSRTSKLFDRLIIRRNNVADSIINFPFNKKRVRVLSTANEVVKDCDGVLYWMFRDGRIQDNWAFLFAQKLALKNRVSLHVCYCILPKFLDATLRHYKFLVESLEEVANDCKDLNINFHLLHGFPNSVVLNFIKKHNMGALVVDFSPLQTPMDWVDDLKKNLPSNIPLCQVDAHNVIPCWISSPKQEYSIPTIKTKMLKILNNYLTEFPPIIKHPYDSNLKIDKINWKNCLKYVDIDDSVDKVDWCKPGYRTGLNQLEIFINERLKDYHEKRNNPLENVCSDLSPWINFGMISAQRVIIEVNEYENKYEESVENFIELALFHRELCDNFCFYNENYDRVDGALLWTLETFNKHQDDKRGHIYSLEEFEESQTHDDLWNAAQNQLKQTGKMHGFLRQYWAKKMIEWTNTPDDALKFSIYFTNKYSIDGCDPISYGGCMWAICGVHDHPWTERQVTGKIRYLNYKGCERKFDVQKFVRKYNGRVVNKEKVMSPKCMKKLK